MFGLFRKKLDTDLTAEMTQDDLRLTVTTVELQQQIQDVRKEQSVEDFQRKALSVIVSHFEEGPFGKYPEIIKEIKFFVYYSLKVLHDDFSKGEKIFKNQITDFDDYVFSHYRKIPELRKNIKKISHLAFTRRFDNDPKKNLLCYFVFLEESGIEYTHLMKDFYLIMERSVRKNIFYKIIDVFKRKPKINDIKAYFKSKEQIQREDKKLYEHTLWTVHQTQSITNIMEEKAKNSLDSSSNEYQNL